MRQPCLYWTCVADVACNATAEWLCSYLWTSWKINTRTGSHQCPEPSRKSSNCAVAGAPRSWFPWLVLVLWGWVKPQVMQGECSWQFAVWVSVSEMYEMITCSVKSPREMHYLPPCFLMVFSHELSAALDAMINVQNPWSCQKWIWEPRWGQCYYTAFLLLSKSLCVWQCELTAKWKCVPPT